MDASDVIAKLGRRMKKRREHFWESQRFFIRAGKRFGKDEAALFFHTRGCRHDAQGGCTMCDYSSGPSVDAKSIVDGVRQGLAELPAGLSCLLISPSGSFLDPWEVPVEARAGILAAVAETGYPAIAFETRAETVTEDALCACRAALPDRCLKVYCGLESADPWVSRYALNKALDPASFVAAMQILHVHGVTGVANVLVGAPFLHEREAIDDAVASVRWALGAGAKEFCLFPCHVKRWTQVAWLHDHGFYSPPSLWSLIEVLWLLGKDTAATRGEIAWFTDYGAFNITESPTTCPQCRDAVIGQLYGFSETNDYAYIESLVRIDCPCKERWREGLQTLPGMNRKQRAQAAYDRIGEEIFAARWPSIRSELLDSLDVSPQIIGTQQGVTQ
ncbi:hypothetical protein [Marichromatium gracile]|uniref:Elp3/MiaA/NifB-like radical SAM core domain-containing protein n=1 Tax=Marichromatium gracile TaxID=1048 RepID=A0A4R4A4L3_MARGR|nr:hypothetical protein [Marichromatium gracile]TCW32704.1 hypothetical protein EDC29_11770 [Marichromatium gracile]